ncbi:mannosyltransferase family protein, partial [Nitrolancea hollandica]|uniref:mannosyltransferase family protein n=1 Tax=Nitrolancea hollandica TaxID=1206749 RepID=UPI0023785F62
MGSHRAVSPAGIAPGQDTFRRTWEGIRTVLVDVTVVFLLSRLLFYGAALLAPYLVPAYAGDSYEPWHTGASTLIDASWRWDSAWYGDIMRQGYDDGQRVAFFPLYPLLVRGLLVVLPDGWLYFLGAMVNHVLFAAALVLVWLYAASLGGPAIARRTIIWLSLFPTAFFFSSAYSESLFLLLGAGTLLCLQRGRFAAAGLAGALATLTRPTGVILAVPCLVDLIRRREIDWRRGLLPLLLIPMGIASYM